MAKLTLDINALTEDFFADTRLAGFVASVKSYRFCWLINKSLGYNFRLQTNIVMELSKKGRKYTFPVYEHSIRNSTMTHYIYHNHFDGEYLLPEFRHIDFLWLLKGEGVEDESFKEIIKIMKTISSVQLAVELTNEKIKNKGNLIF